MEVYSLVSSTKDHPPNFTKLPLVTDLFIHKPSQLPGSTQPGCHSGAQNYSNTRAFTVLPGTHLLLGRESARVSKVPCLGAQRRIQPGIESAISRL